MWKIFHQQMQKEKKKKTVAFDQNRNLKYNRKTHKN